MNPEDFLALATAVAKGAGLILMQRYKTAATGVESKSTPTDLVSDADLAAEEYIVGEIHKHRPGDGVLAEEGSEAKSTTGFKWIVDPLDGTVNFLYRIPHWTTSIAIADHHGVFAGAIWDPNRDELFTALRGQGAHLNGSPIQVSSETDLTRSLVGTGFAYDVTTRSAQADLAAKLLREVRDVRRGGASTLDVTWVACGRLDGYFESNLMTWDRAAAELVLTEAGGMFASMESPSGKDNGLMAAGPGIFEELKQTLERLGAGFERNPEVIR